MTKPQFRQEPVAIVGFACRLPGGNNDPQRLWDFLERGSVAPNAVPETRFRFEGHYDGSHKPRTMRQAGGMFLGDVDPADFDASFFEVSTTEAVAMDPNQRQMLEVVYEGLENAGIPLERLERKPVACFVGSYASDYGDMQNRDPEDRPANNALGVGRAILANRLSHFLNIRGPSATIDTACSASLVGLDMACRYLSTGEVDAAIIATSNIYMSPEHMIDAGNVGSAHSPTALCHTFDVAADGYVKAEAVSAVIVKRLTDAIRDRDPIRAVVLGTATTSNGRTAGIASPSSEAQAQAIRQAYANAGITDLNLTAYLECHGTGTQAGDPTEVRGAGSVFAPTRPADKPLLIGSIKSNIGHSEPAAGISGLLKAVLAIEHGVIPGSPTFINPSPKIDFVANRVKAFRHAVPWPQDTLRRASVNSFGYGGSNAHAIVQAAAVDRARHVKSYTAAGEEAEEEQHHGGDGGSDEHLRPQVVVLSANDAQSLHGNIAALTKHLLNPRVRVRLGDLAYTLSERRTRLWHRAFATTRSAESIDEKAFVTAKKGGQPPRVGFVFTGQGAQWSQMGAELVRLFPRARTLLGELDAVLQRQQAWAAAPSWSLVEELTQARSAEHLRQPELSQPLVTALQLCLLDVLDSWGVRPDKVVGHSSGEIAAAYAAGLLDRAGAIKAAYYRGRAAANCIRHGAEKEVGMLAVGLGAEAAQALLDEGDYAGRACVACFNSPSSVTISGTKAALESLQEEVKAAGFFARLLQVDLAYHSAFMGPIGDEYEKLLNQDPDFAPYETGSSSTTASVTMYSSVTGALKTGPADATYWKDNMVSPVRFDEALRAMLSDSHPPTVLIEIGPSGALAGPASQVIKSLPATSSAASGAQVPYHAAWSRGTDPAKALFDVAGRLFISGGDVDLGAVNGYDDDNVRTVVDLPNYAWNHTVKYWHENASSRDWRFRKYVAHDLLGSKILGTPWQAPIWRNRLSAANVPWLLDHKMGGDAIMPGAGFVTLGLEAMWQKHCAVENVAGVAPNDLGYRFRNLKFHRALVVEENKDIILTVSLAPRPGDKHWHEFRVSSTLPGEDEHLVREHCWGLVRIQDAIEDERAEGPDAAPLRSPQGPKLWYKAEREIAMDFGPAFQRLLQIEAVSGQRSCRTLLSLAPPPSRWTPQSYYPIHPAALDGCLQTPIPANAEGERGNIKAVMIPGVIDDLVINKVPAALTTGRSVARSTYSGRGRREEDKSWIADTTVYDAETGRLVMRVRGLHYLKLDVPPRPDPHTFLRVAWKPDVSLLSQDQLVQHVRGGLAGLVDLMAHKTPSLRVLEVNLDAADTSSLWFPLAPTPASTEARSAYARYDFASTDARAMVSVQERLQDRVQTSFLLLNPAAETGEALGLAADAVYDLVIIKASEDTNPGLLQNLIANMQSFLSEAAFTLLVVGRGEANQKGTVSPPRSEVAAQSSTPSTSSSASETASKSGDTAPAPASTASSVSAADADDATKLFLSSSGETFWSWGAVQRLIAKAGVPLGSVLAVPTAYNTDDDGGDGDENDGTQAYLWQRSTRRAELRTTTKRGNLLVARLSRTGPSPLGSSIRAELQQAGWNVKQQHLPLSPLSRQEDDADVVLVLDELVGPVLAKISTPQLWNALKELISSGKPVVWVTQGAQGQAGTGGQSITEPDRAMVHGLFRVARREDERARLVTLDVQSAIGSSDTSRAICQVLEAVRHDSETKRDVAQDGDEGGEATATMQETEYMERGGQLYVQRLVPDQAVNHFKRAEVEGLEPRLTDFHGTPAQLQLHAERLGTLQSLMWCETGVHDEDPLEHGHIEVEVMAVGVNFKDVATTMGIVPEDEHMIGFECAGVVRKIGGGVTRFRLGDRVCILKPGSYANRVRVAVERCHAIPDTMTFEEAATIPSVYLCSLYSLYHMANLKEGQSVLIHSATGGVGIACIQLAQYKKAEIYVTVGTEEKRQFLETHFGIPRDHMFSSRTIKFADEIMRHTKGRGVDCVVNSLVGELLDASWRIIADGGTMVEIGKRDIVDRNTLAMEPFDRNCSFRAVDMSFTKDIHDQRIASLFAELFVLIDGGHLQPIRPITTFGFDDVPAALQYIRSGRHLGKIVISNREKEEAIQVVARPAVRKLQLRPDVSYLIVGGLKGACGTLATHLAVHGARHIIVSSRSGIADEGSVRIIRNCAFYGCAVSEAKGDIGDLETVRRMFQTASPRIGGVIQGAMVLRDRPLENMTLDDYRTAIHAKVQGTWNLHRASQEAGRKHALDFFTMLSSTSGIIGNKGQANYAAANTFLDAFASYRCSLGLRAHTVDLGVIEDVGYVAEQDTDSLEARFDKNQWSPIGETMLRRILTYSILQQTPDDEPIGPLSAAQMITGVAVPLSLTDSNRDLAREPRFAYLFATHTDGDAGAKEDKGSNNDAADQAVRALKTMYKSGAEGPALLQACVDALAAQFVKILRLESEVEPGRPLIAYGLDSLSAVELRNWIRAKLAVELTTLDITNASSLIALGEKVVGKLSDQKRSAK